MARSLRPEALSPSPAGSTCEPQRALAGLAGAALLPVCKGDEGGGVVAAAGLGHEEESSERVAGAKPYLNQLRGREARGPGAECGLGAVWAESGSHGEPCALRR